VLTEMVTSLQAEKSTPQCLYVVGSGVDVTADNAHLKDLVSVPVITPEEPQLALARGAALASANAPRYDATTVGLAYSQVPDATVIHPLTLADDATAFLGHDTASADTAYILSDPDVPERTKPFLLMAGSLSAIFIAGVLALTIALVSNVRSTADQGSDDMTVHPDAAAPAAPQQVPETVPAPAPEARPPAPIESARLKVAPAPPAPRVVVRNVAPPAAPPPGPAAPPPVVLPPGIPAPIIEWLPPNLLPPPFFNPGPKPKKPPGGHRGGGGHGGRHGHGGGD